MDKQEQKTITRRLRTFHYTECGAFEEYLRRMSMKGLHFRGWKAGMIFEKGEPEETVYSVEVFDRGKETDLRPEPDAEEFAGSCEAAGWEFIDGNRRFCVFRRRSENAVPIMSEEERFSAVRRAEIRGAVRYTSVYLILNLIFGVIAYLYPELWMFSDTYMLVILLIPFMLLMNLGEYISLFLWYVRGKMRLSSGEGVMYPSRLWYTAENILITAALLVIILWMAAERQWYDLLFVAIIVILQTGSRFRINYIRPSREEQKWYSLWAVIAVAAVVFLLNVMRPAEDYSWAGMETSILGTAEQGYINISSDREEMTDYDYKLYRSEYPGVIRVVWWSQSRDMKAPAGIGGGWDAEEVTSDDAYSCRIFVRYDDAVLVLYGSEEPGEREIRILRDRLGLS